jgi:hypothetical protein
MPGAEKVRLSYRVAAQPDAAALRLLGIRALQECISRLWEAFGVRATVWLLERNFRGSMFVRLGFLLPE